MKRKKREKREEMKEKRRRRGMKCGLGSHVMIFR
jgi:hypothetical protein